MAKRKFKPGDKVEIVNNKRVEEWFSIGDKLTIDSFFRAKNGLCANFEETPFVALTRRLKLVTPA